jgi:hypothetical protein
VENGFDELGYFPASNWYNTNGATPDFYGSVANNECYINSYFSNDFSIAGEWQLPRTGDKYVGLWLADEQSISREYLTVKLISPLLVDTCYYVSGHLVLSNIVTLACDGFGFYFSSDSISDFGNPGVLSVQPQVVNTLGNIITDTLDWTEVSGSFVAEGGESYLTLGNHWTNEMTSLLNVDGTTGWSVAYYYVDDISVIKCSDLSQVNIQRQIAFDCYPNPTNGKITIDAPEFDHYELHDSTGRIVAKGVIHDSLILDLSRYEKGVYILTVMSDQLQKRKKILRQ